MSAQTAAASTKPRVVDARGLRAMLDDGEELAILDLREELIFSQNHLLHARSAPLSRLELLIDRLVPRRATRIVLCDDADGLAERAAAVLARGGYGDVAILEGGCAGWEKAGFELFSGVNVPSKAFGEFIEHESGTPSIAAEELARLMRERADIAVLDSRPFDEYVRVSIPTATNVPGAELIAPGALMAALRQGCPGSAAVDVYEEEPAPPDHPLLAMPNVLCTPHSAWAEWENFELYFREAYEQIIAFERGAPLRLANPAVKPRAAGGGS